MAETADARPHLTALESIARTLADLPEVAEQWAGLSVDEQLGWSLDWGNEMSKLEEVASRASEGSLTAAEQACYRDLVAAFEAALPTINALKLRRPSVPLGNEPQAAPSEVASR